MSQPSVAPTDWRLFLAGTLALPLATIPANVELAEVQAAWGVSINQNQMAARSAPILPRLINEADKKDAPGDSMLLRSVSPG